MRRWKRNLRPPAAIIIDFFSLFRCGLLIKNVPATFAVFKKSFFLAQFWAILPDRVMEKLQGRSYEQQANLD